MKSRLDRVARLLGLRRRALDAAKELLAHAENALREAKAHLEACEASHLETLTQFGDGPQTVIDLAERHEQLEGMNRRIRLAERRVTLARANADTARARVLASAQDVQKMERLEARLRASDAALRAREARRLEDEAAARRARS